jgi:hypothetical protein
MRCAIGICYEDNAADYIKRPKLQFFVLEGNICARLAAKDHVNIFLYDRVIVRIGNG